jgi:hypothetical protein
MERYVLVLFSPLHLQFCFFKLDFLECCTLDWAEREALAWKSTNEKNVVRLFCVGIVKYRGNREVEPHDLIEAFKWSEDRKRWRHQYHEPAPAEAFVQFFDPVEMSYGHSIGSDVPANASWQPVGKNMDVQWGEERLPTSDGRESDIASQREQKLQDENQSLRDQIELLENQVSKNLEMIESLSQDDRTHFSD